MKEEKCYRCRNGHSFDIARQGYVNLNLKQRKDSGDNALMIHARSEFLEKGYYQFLRDRITELLQLHGIQTLLDAGCGQGYYTRAFAQVVDQCYGVDLSKCAIQYAASHDKNGQYFVSSLFSCPFRDGSFDGVTSIFVPEAKDEIHRLLKKDGLWIEVGPGAKHLWHLKEELYEVPYENKVERENKEGFLCILEEEIHCEHRVHSWWDLLEMTPYRYKTKKESLERIKQIQDREVRFDFVIRVWKKL